VTRLSPVLAALPTYPFVRLDDARKQIVDAGLELIDFGMGDPREPTPAFIREALASSIEEISQYPRAAGLPELREAIGAWIGRRYGVEVNPHAELVPTLGSKEAIFSFAQVVVDAESEKRLVVVTEPGYPVQERGALFAHAEPRVVPLREAHGFLPDLAEIDFWDRVAIFWVNYPNNPTGATAPLSFFEELAERAHRHDFYLCSDEAYSELWFDEPPASAIQVADRTNVVVFNTLSKRSSMTGYRSGFVAAPPEVVAALRKFRPSVGTAPQEFVQHASVAAWGDERHVEDVREVYRRKRETIVAALKDRGARIAGSAATFYLWVEAREDAIERLLAQGVVVTPGEYFGAAGAGYLRIALVPTQEQCERAAAIIREVL
jgi:succinyldiaminopimelate transaminase